MRLRWWHGYLEHVQMICVWSRWCHCHHWCQLTHAVLEKRPLNGCLSVCLYHKTFQDSKEVVWPQYLKAASITSPTNISLSTTDKILSSVEFSLPYINLQQSFKSVHFNDNNNKWSQLFDIRPHCHHTQSVQSYSSGGAKVHPIYIESQKMVAMAMSLSCSVSAISAFCWPTT